MQGERAGVSRLDIVLTPSPQNFFLDLRLAIASREPHPEYHNLYTSDEDCRCRAGAKLKGLVKLLLHCFKHDDVEMPVYKRGTKTVWPKTPKTENAETRKVVVWHEFTMMADLIASVSQPPPSSTEQCVTCCIQALDAHNLNVVILNGKMSGKQRAAAVNKFKHSEDAEVLLTSTVGMVGLNLTCADVVIAYVSHLLPLAPGACTLIN